VKKKRIFVKNTFSFYQTISFCFKITKYIKLSKSKISFGTAFLFAFFIEIHQNDDKKYPFCAFNIIGL